MSSVAPARRRSVNRSRLITISCGESRSESLTPMIARTTRSLIKTLPTAAALTVLDRSRVPDDVKASGTRMPAGIERRYQEPTIIPKTRTIGMRIYGAELGGDGG